MFYPWVRKIPWRRKWQVTPVFLPGESHGQRSLAGSLGLQIVRHNLAAKQQPQVLCSTDIVHSSVGLCRHRLTIMTAPLLLGSNYLLL